MTIRFAVTPHMLYRAQRAVMRHITWMHVGGYFVLLLFPLILVAINLAYGGTAMGALRENGVLYVVLALFWLLGIPLITRWNAGRTLRATPAFQGQIEYSFDENGVEIRTAISASHLGWATFVRAVETKEFFLLFQNKVVATFLPKSAFGGTGDLEEFRSLALTRLGQRAA